MSSAPGRTVKLLLSTSGVSGLRSVGYSISRTPMPEELSTTDASSLCGSCECPCPNKGTNESSADVDIAVDCIFRVFS